MTVTLAAAASVYVLGTAVWLWIFRRRVPRFETRNLREVSSTRLLREQSAVRFEAVSKISNDDRQSIYEAFYKSPGLQWMARGGRYEQIYRSGRPVASEDQQDLEKCASYIFNMILTHCEDYGHVLVARDSTSGDFLGAVGWTPPYQSPRLARWHSWRSSLRLGTPPPYGISNGARLRYDAFGTDLEANMRPHPKWCLAILAVTPSAQGKGVGRCLVEIVLAHVRSQRGSKGATKASSTAVCLECHDGNVAFYEKFGFSSHVRFAIKPEKEQNLESWETEPFWYHEMVALR